MTSIDPYLRDFFAKITWFQLILSDFIWYQLILADLRQNTQFLALNALTSQIDL